MKKVFIVTMEAYNDYGKYLFTNIIGVYTTFELAKKKVDRLKELEAIQAEQFIEYLYGIETNLLEGE